MSISTLTFPKTFISPISKRAMNAINKNTWLGLLAGVLFLTIVVLSGMTLWKQSSNAQAEQSNILYPFSGYLTPPNGPEIWTVNLSKNNKGVGPNPEDGLFLVGMVGGEDATVPQIQCPSGYKINIVGAYIDIADPNGSCSTTPNNLISTTCGSDAHTSTSPACQDASSCAVGMDCPAGRCAPKTCKVHGDCASAGVIGACPDALGKGCTVGSPRNGSLVCIGDSGSNAGTWMLDPGAGGACMACDTDGGGNGVCTLVPTCQNNKKGSNLVCSPGSPAGCKPRDASAYLAKHCDDKSVCLDNMTDRWSPNDIGGVFGPLPCMIEASSTSHDYLSLPINVGWAGGSPPQSQSNIDNPATFTQGYYVHGIYTCMPDES